MKRLWTLLGRLVLISMAVNLAVELFSRKSLSGLGRICFWQSAGISVKRTADADSVSFRVFHKKEKSFISYWWFWLK